MALVKKTTPKGRHFANLPKFIKFLTLKSSFLTKLKFFLIRWTFRPIWILTDCQKTRCGITNNYWLRAKRLFNYRTLFFSREVIKCLALLVTWIVNNQFLPWNWNWEEKSCWTFIHYRFFLLSLDETRFPSSNPCLALLEKLICIWVM